MINSTCVIRLGWAETCTNTANRLYGKHLLMTTNIVYYQLFEFAHKLYKINSCDFNNYVFLSWVNLRYAHVEAVKSYKYQIWSFSKHWKYDFAICSLPNNTLSKSNVNCPHCTNVSFHRTIRLEKQNGSQLSEWLRFNLIYNISDIA